MPHGEKLKTFFGDMAPVVELLPDSLIMADPGFDFAGALPLAGHAHPSLGAGQHHQCGGGAVLAARGPRARDPSRELSLEEIARSASLARTWS